MGSKARSKFLFAHDPQKWNPVLRIMRQPLLGDQARYDREAALEDAHGQTPGETTNRHRSTQIGLIESRQAIL
jgi:hypothetical protein